MNPWLTVPAEEYEAHMAADVVAQWDVLARLFGSALARYRPRRLCVVGCGTGNGFEHIDPLVTTRVVALDLNPQYLELVRRRHAARLPGLELLEANLLEAELPAASFDQLYVALVLEYVPLMPALARMVPWLARGGVLSLVLQQPSPYAPAVMPTSDSLRPLASIMRLIEPDVLLREASEQGLVQECSSEVALRQGKSFLAVTFRRADD